MSADTRSGAAGLCAELRPGFRNQGRHARTRADPAIGAAALTLPVTSFESALTGLINDVAQSPHEIIMVLDAPLTD